MIRSAPGSTDADAARPVAAFFGAAFAWAGLDGPAVDAR